MTKKDDDSSKHSLWRWIGGIGAAFLSAFVTRIVDELFPFFKKGWIIPWLVALLVLTVIFCLEKKAAKNKRRYFSFSYTPWLLTVAIVIYLLLINTLFRRESIEARNKLLIPATIEAYEQTFLDRDEVALAQGALDAFNAGEYAYAVLLYNHLPNYNNFRSWYANRPRYAAALLAQNPSLVGYADFYANLNKLVSDIELDVSNRSGVFNSYNFIGATLESVRIVRERLPETERTNLLAVRDKIAELQSKLPRK